MAAVPVLAGAAGDQSADAEGRGDRISLIPIARYLMPHSARSLIAECDVVFGHATRSRGRSSVPTTRAKDSGIL